MGFVDFFIRRVVFAIVCAIIIVIAGSVVIPSLPIAQYPQIALPQVVVAASYVGASSAEVESGVTIPLEQQINGVQGMKYITSSSSSDGSSVITVTFDASRDIDLAAVDVQNRVNTALARLPVDVRNLGVTITKNSGSFVGAYALFTQDERYDEKFLSNYADVYMKDRLKRISGVADVIIFGERRFSMRLWLDPARLAARNMSPGDVLTALREQNVQVAAGSVGLPPAPSGQTYQISVRAIGRLIEASEFEDVVVKSLPDGTIVRLKDVGRAELGAESYSQLSRWKGKRAVGLGIEQLPGSNALDVKKKVDATVAQLAKEFPPGLVYETAFDTTAPVSASINDVVITLLQAILLVIATIYLFLQSLRSTLIPAITIPVSLLGTFAFVKLFGFSINTLTLFGLTLATGLVVDDAIVVIENIARVMEQQHLSPREAASKGMREVTGAVIATSLVLIAVFVPVAFIPGTTGKIYQQFSLTIAFSIALSAFNAITLTPALSARLLRVEDHGPGAKKNVVFRTFDRGFEALRRGYTRGLKVAIRFRAVTALVFVALLGATGWLFTHVPQAFIPDEDQGYFIVIVQGPEGSSLEVTSETMRGVEQTLAQVPEIQGCFSVPGFSLLGSGPNKGAIFCSLIPWEQRKKPGQDAMSLVARLRGPLMGVGGAFVLPFSPPAIQGVGNVGGFQFEIEDQTSEPKIDNLAQATFGLMAAGNKDPNLRSVFSAFTANDPQIVVEVDRDRAKALGVSLDEVFATLQIYMGSAYVNDFVFGTRTYRVYVQADQQFRAQPTDLTSFYARSIAGQMVPLAELVKVTNTATAQSIDHYNLFRSTEIQGSPGPGRQLRPGAPRDGEDGQGAPAAWLLVRVVRIVARAAPVGWANPHHLRPRDRLRVSGAGGSVRELRPAVHHHPVGPRGHARGAPLPDDAWLLERRVLSGGAGHAHRHVEQERDPHRGVRTRAARDGQIGHPCRSRSCRDAPPADPHDVDGVSPGRGPAARRDRRRLGRPPLARHHGVRGDAPLHRAEPLFHPGALHPGRDAARAGARRGDGQRGPERDRSRSGGRRRAVMKRAARFTLAALAAAALVLPWSRDAAAQGDAPTAGPQKPAVKPARPARTDADTTTDEVRTSDDALPPAPAVVDRMLDAAAAAAAHGRELGRRAPARTRSFHRPASRVRRGGEGRGQSRGSRSQARSRRSTPPAP